jgi:membrane protein YqaA with SNARE-associated domain
VLALGDSAGIPLVGGVDALLIAVSVEQPENAYLAALCAIAGSVAGSLILFGIAHKGGEVFLSQYISKGRGKRLHAWFERYGLVTVFIPAISPLPMPMKIPVFCAGALEVSWRSFISVVVVARVVRYLALTFLALKYGHATLGFLKTHWLAVLAIALSLAIAAVIAIRLTERTFQK